MWMNYLANTAIPNIQIFRRYNFRLWVFASTGEYLYCWHWRLLHNVLQSKYDAKTFKNLIYIILRFELTQIIMCIVCNMCNLQIGSFN